MYTAQEKTQLTLQYEPLINKLTAQFYHSVQYDWDSIKSMAYEGFALALEKYDPDRSNMNFKQYAAFAMRNNILTGLTEESRTVKLPFEEQKKRKENGGALYNTVSIEPVMDADGVDLYPRTVMMAVSEDAKFADGDVFEYMKSRLTDQFPLREAEMFFMTFGICGYPETPNKDIAKHFNVSEGLISQKKAKIIAWIKKDRELCEMLSNLL